MEESTPAMGCSGPSRELTTAEIADHGFKGCCGVPPAVVSKELGFPPGGMSFGNLQFNVGIWQNYNFGPQPAYRQILGALEELGELAHAQLKLEQGIRGTPEEHKAAAKDAVGDVIIFLANYCNTQGFKLQQIMEDTWAEISKRDWKRFPKNGTTE